MNYWTHLLDEDLASGLHEIEMSPKVIDKTAFHVEFGNVQ